MQLDRVDAVLRPRTSWEGVDLGVAMLQRWWRPVLTAWLFVFVPVCAVALGFLREYLVLPLFLLWWLGPLFDRIVVHVLSHALFGDVPPLITTLRACPRLLGRGLPLALVPHRLHPAHTLVQPVAQLEGVRGSQRRQRERVLARETGGIAWLASAFNVLFHFALTASVMLLLCVMLPSELLPDFEPLWEGRLAAFEPGWLTRAAQIAWIVTYCIIGPLNAAIGFGLYINRRTQLEGWDVEVAFRRLAARVDRQVRRATAGIGAAVLLACAFLVLGPRTASAQEQSPSTAPAPAAQEKPSDVISRVKADREFETEREVERWDFDFNFPESKGGGGPNLSFLGPLLELLLWTALAALLVFIVVQVSKRLGWIDALRATPPPALPPTHLFGLDLRPESLPADIAAAVRELWSRGEAVAALGLLYRAAISRLVERDGLALETSDTENDCLRRTRSLANPTRVDYFTAVTRAWLTCAYSGARPTNEFVEQLCSDWNERFEARAA